MSLHQVSFKIKNVELQLNFLGSRIMKGFVVFQQGFLLVKETFLSCFVTVGKQVCVDLFGTQV